MSSVQTVELCWKERNQPTKAWLRTPPGFSRASMLLMVVCSTYGFCMRCPEESGPVVRMNQEKSESPPAKRPVTVADSIQMTRLGDTLYNDGAPSKGLVAKFSPNGKRFVVVLRKGNLETNMNEYSLILFETDDAFRSPSPRVLLSMSSSSNRPAIQNVVWMDDNDTILFLGENPNETTQLYSLRCSSRELKQLTHHATNLSSFVAVKNGEIVFAAENPAQQFLNEHTARYGINVTNELLIDLITGKHGGGEYDDHTLFIKQEGSEAETMITTEGRVQEGAGSLSPDGQHLVIQTEAKHVPNAWTEYDDQYLKAARQFASAPRARTSILQYELVDIPTHKAHLLVDAPISPSRGSETVWSPDSQSVVVANAYLPLNTDDVRERSVRKTHTFLVEVRISSGQLVKMSDEDLRLLDWDAKTNAVVCDVGRLESFRGKAASKEYFGKRNDTWARLGTPPGQEKVSLPEIVLDENMNQPPQIFAINPNTRAKVMLMDPNPQFQSLAFAKVEEVAFKTYDLTERAGLYWPLDYVAGRKYPLVIQTHAWDPDRFWIDGPWTTAFAAQELAGKGFFVLQVGEFSTLKEAPAAMAMYDGAIDFLNRKGLIDRTRVGIIGFSRTYWYITYMLTHSKRHIAAAAIADGVDYSYFQYMAFPDDVASEFEEMYGGPPYGRSLSRWLKESPAFHMDKIETPLRIQTLYPTSLLSDWHWFSGLTRLGKPVEMVYIPEGTHILEKPWDRMISQQGNVDWFCFWLRGEEDTDPAKAEQYNRWRNLRASGSKDTANTKDQ